INGPILGFIEDSGGATIQPIRGVLGASVVGGPLELGSEIRNVIVSPKQNYALAIRGENAEPVVILLAADSGTINSLDGLRSGANLIAVSPTGSAAGVFGQSEKIVQVIKGMPDAPELAFQLDASDFPGQLQSMSVSDDGSLVLLGFNTPDESALWVVSS